MKLLPSSSVSSSSSFDPDFCSPKRASSSFLSGILRRILCLRNLPTYPSEFISETSSIVENQTHFGKLDQSSNGGSSPGIVARLMGLESFPETAAGNDRFLRSRSMNSAEFRDFNGEKSLHRRVKSTLSVREVLTFEEEDEEFFVLRFDNGGDQKEEEEEDEKIEKMVSRIASEGCISSRISDEFDQENDELESLQLFDLMNCDELNHEAKKRKNKKDYEEEILCNSEESSPVSVLDFNQFHVDPSELETEFTIKEQSSKNSKTCQIPPKKSIKSLDCSKLWAEIRRLSEFEVISADWIRRNRSKIEGIGEELGDQIMDELVEEVVDLQLV